MKYKQSYLAYKLRFCWPFIDILASYFNLVLNVAVIAFALYHQISVFYCVCLFFMVLQSLTLSQHNRAYRAKKRKQFTAQAQREMDALAFEERFGYTAQQELAEKERKFTVMPKPREESLKGRARRRSSGATNGLLARRASQLSQ